jgi:hypothetical protein
MKFTLLEISTYGWIGISFCSIESDWYNKSLFHLEYNNSRWIVNILFMRFV